MGFPAELGCRQASGKFRSAGSNVPVMVVVRGFFRVRVLRRYSAGGAVAPSPQWQGRVPWVFVQS